MNIFAPDLERHKVEFAREFVSDTLYAKSDAVITNLATGELSIYEVKSSASVKEEHIHDVAFQKAAAEACGERVAHAFVIVVNTAYVRNGAIDPEAICKIEDVTAKVFELKEYTSAKIAEAFHYLAVDPDPAILGYCASKLDCVFIRHHHPNLPDYTVFDLANLKAEKRDSLLARGIINIRDIPDDFEITPRQRRFVTVARSGAAHIDYDEIKKSLEGLAYPLYFLDYETFSCAVPHRDGIRPYQQMAFQYSLHGFDAPGIERPHSKYLSDGGDNPPLELARSLRDAMNGEIGTVVVWSQGFEKNVNKQIGEMFPEFAEFFGEINEKLFDLRKIFSDLLYMHPAFLGSTSIKNVMPVLAPLLSYKGLDIGDGMTASIKWFHMATRRGTEEERQATFEALCEYCHLDTKAMVEIFKVLKAL